MKRISLFKCSGFTCVYNFEGRKRKVGGSGSGKKLKEERAGRGSACVRVGACCVCACDV